MLRHILTIEKNGRREIIFFDNKEIANNVMVIMMEDPFYRTTEFGLPPWQSRTVFTNIGLNRSKIPKFRLVISNDGDLPWAIGFSDESIATTVMAEMKKDSAYKLASLKITN